MEKEIEKPLQLPDKEQSLESIISSRRIFDLHRERGDSLGEIISGGNIAIGMTDSSLLELTITEPELLREYHLRNAEFECVRMRYLAEEGYRFFNGGGDMATMTNTVISPRTLKEILSGPLKMFASACSKEDVVFCFRSDGNMWGVFDILFDEFGVQAYGEVDRDATMTVKKIRERNSNVIILGNMSSAFLHLQNEEAVRNETRKMLEESEGLNFIPGPSNAIMHGTPIKNIFAMIEEIEAFKP